MRRIVLLLILITFVSCNNTSVNVDKKKQEIQQEKPQEISYKEKELVLNDSFDIGDVRRYGIFPDSSFTYTHPVTNKPKITSVLDLAEQTDLEIFFPKGFYNMALILDGRENLKMKFDHAEFDMILIKKGVNKKKNLKSITLKGTIITYDRLGITEAQNIRIDTVYIRSDITKNKRKLRSRGCHIYYGSKDILIKHLEIDDFGSGGEKYKNNHAALALDGWRNNPENVTIHKLHIKSSDRHGIYLTGKNHKIDEIIIDQFGVGDDIGMSGMQDAGEIEHKLFSGIWINRCYNSSITSLTINAGASKGFFTANFDEGDSLRPTIIDKLEIIKIDRKLPIRFAKNTGVIVKEIIK
ncbi:MAG: hypothetical protein JXQ93_08485 [Flavobacteriaceae bacterium]